MSPAKSRKTNPYIPHTRVTTMLVMLAIVIGGIFGMIVGNWIAGGLVGLLFAGGVYLIVVVSANSAVGKKKRRR